tara:strand:+ start:352 stop:1026 length:675 start_codon:yes stop_codon:yes gene_type:complete
MMLFSIWLRRCLHFLVWLAGMLRAIGTLAAPALLSFGIVPQQSAVKLATAWAQLLAKLWQRSGVRLRFATASDIPTFEQRLRDGMYDLAYMNPYHYTVLHESPGYGALGHAKDSLIWGIFVVRRDACLSQHSGLTLTYPAPNAFAVMMITRAGLADIAEFGPANYVLSQRLATAAGTLDVSRVQATPDRRSPKDRRAGSRRVQADTDSSRPGFAGAWFAGAAAN